jgi:hypothetical protein
MVLTTNRLETKRFARQLNTTARQDIAASYTGETKNSDSILRQFENENGNKNK